MSRRLLALVAVLLLLFAGLHGVARAAVTASAAAEQVILIEQETAPLQTGEASPADLVEPADGPLLPLQATVPPVCHGRQSPPCPALRAGHPAPCLDGLLRPPALHA
jgi:hypothetical protein